MPEGWAGVELHAPAGEPIAQQPVPCLPNLPVSALELADRVLASGNHGHLVVARPDEVLRHLHSGVVAHLLGCGDTRVIVADAVPRPAVQAVRLHPSINLRDPEV